MKITNSTLICVDNISLCTFGAFVALNSDDDSTLDKEYFDDARFQLETKGYANLDLCCHGQTTLSLVSPLDNVCKAYSLTAQGGNCDARCLAPKSQLMLEHARKLGLPVYDANYTGLIDSREAYE